jgi:N-acyl-D-aspartate/D-glutamate deacylase
VSRRGAGRKNAESDQLMDEFDLVVRAGTVIDGSGGPPVRADVAINGGIIVAVGDVRGHGRRELDADGAIVAPGFVDIHTHYDGQAIWDSYLQPSSWHGVTTVVTGNCGVGFAPARSEHQDKLIELMEGVEDIPGTVLHEGLSWEWNSFEEYLQALERRARDVDIATQVPHAPLRHYVMGDRALAFEQATDDEIATMARVAKEAIRAGALGFSTDRSPVHRTKAGEHTPTYGSSVEELLAIVTAIGSTGTGVLQYVTDFPDLDEQFALMRHLVRASGRPLSVSIVQERDRPERYHQVLDHLTAANDDGLCIRGQVASRAIGLILGLECTLHPFMMNPVWRSISHLPVEEQAMAMATPDMRAAILAAQTQEADPNLIGGVRIARYDSMYKMSDPPDYEPNPDCSIAALAAKTGRSPEDIAYDAIIDDDGHGLIYQPFNNYGSGSLDAVREMLMHEHTLPGLGDGGAHVGALCDSSFTTFQLQYWVRDRARERLDLPFVIQRQARDTAWAVGLRDRGLLQPGYKADLNVIDMTALRLHKPRMAYDLPTGGRRMMQRADGYRHTVVSGVETYRNGEPTSALPGAVVRGPHPAPAHAVDA